MPSRLQLLSILLAAIGCMQGIAVASEPPCSYADIHPTYPSLNAPPDVATGDGAALPTGANCFAADERAATWTTVAAVLQTSFGQDELVRQFGAISRLPGLLYWSTSDQAWRPMVTAAFAVGSADSHAPRADYSAAELMSGTSRYYRVTDTRTYAPINYRLQLRPNAPGRIVLETTNVDPIKKWGLTLYAADGLHTLYFLNERAPGIWSYYSVTRATPATYLARGHEKSYINRAVALFRHYMRLPAADEPPAAR